MNITTRQLKAFVLTSRHQSFSRAAEELFITQSGMSVLVRELETQLAFLKGYLGRIAEQAGATG